MIYVTPFRASDKLPTAVSTDSGFGTLDEVVAMMGDGYIRRYNKSVIYGDDKDRVIFCHFPFCVDMGDVIAYSLRCQQVIGD